MDSLHDYRYTPEKLSFYITAGDQDMLGQINRIMSRSGYVGVMDTAGRLHYLIDGRRGSPFASRRILEATGRIMRDQLEAGDPLRNNLVRFVDPVLVRHKLRPELKGYQYVRYLLLAVGLDESLLRPISKTLYPTVASHYQVNISQIERDIRYSLLETDLHQHGLTTTAAISRLYHELIRLAESAESMAGQTDAAAESLAGQTDAAAVSMAALYSDDTEKLSLARVSDGELLPQRPVDD